MKRYTILVVDDDTQIIDFLRPSLKSAGYEVLTACDGVEALVIARNQEPDIMVLDLTMPKLDGFETLNELRSFSAMPVIFLSARGTDPDIIKGLEMGADDYLSKPFNPDELKSRIEAVRRRLKPVNTRITLQPLVFEDLTVDFHKRLIVVDGTEKYLTNIEWLLLIELARNAGRLVTYHHLLATIWGAEYCDDVQLVRSWISRLRHKIEKDPNNPKLIRNLPKVGYSLNPPPV